MAHWRDKAKRNVKCHTCKTVMPFYLESKNGVFPQCNGCATSADSSIGGGEPDDSRAHKLAGVGSFMPERVMSTREEHTRKYPDWLKRGLI